jgi:hypothetical protein
MNDTTSYHNLMKSGIFKLAAFASCLALGTSMALAWGELTTLRVIQTQTILIRYRASEQQRRAAESNAKAFFSQLTPAKKADLKKRNIHTVLIRTVRSRQTSPAAKEVRMRYSLEEVDPGERGRQIGLLVLRSHGDMASRSEKTYKILWCREC